MATQPTAMTSATATAMASATATAMASATASSVTKLSFRFGGEDYTAGCVVRDTVLADEYVVFAGLAVEPTGIVLTVQSACGTPQEALVRSIGRTTHSLQELQGAFQQAVEIYHNR